jgi:hypothetical protein
MATASKQSAQSAKRKRLAALLDPNATPEALLALVDDPDDRVIHGVIRHPNCPTEALIRVAQRSAPEKTHCKIARHPNATAEVLEELAFTLSGAILELVAQHPQVTPELLRQIAQGDDIDGPFDAGVRAHVAANPCTPTDVIVMYINDEDEEVRQAAWTNPALPEEYRALARIAGNPTR